MKYLHRLYIFLTLSVLSILVAISPTANAGPQVQHTPDFFMLASMGKIAGVTVFRKFGVNNEVDTSTAPETVCSYATNRIPQFFSASTVTIVSSSGSDSTVVSATGTKSVYVEGVDGNGILTSETISVTGVTPKTLVNQYMHINRAYGTLTGSGRRNVGDITLKYGDAATDIAQIPAGQGQSQCFSVYVPAGHVWLVDNVSASQNKKTSGTATLHFEIMVDGSNTWRNIFNFGLDATGTSLTQVGVGHSRYFAIPGKSRVIANVDSVSANSNQITASAAGYMFDLSKFNPN